RLARRGGGPGRVELRVRRVERHPINAELGPRDLGEDGREPLSALHAGAVDLDDRTSGPGRKRDASLVEVVEPLAVGDVLVADRETDAPPQPLASPDVPGSAWKRHRMAHRRRLGLGRERGRARELDDLAHRGAARYDLAGREDRARVDRVHESQLDGIDPELAGQPI